jgi:hypothetical protein
MRKANDVRRVLRTFLLNLIFNHLKYYSQFQAVVYFQNQTRNSIQIRSEKFSLKSLSGQNIINLCAIDEKKAKNRRAIKNIYYYRAKSNAAQLLVGARQRIKNIQKN